MSYCLHHSYNHLDFFILNLYTMVINLQNIIIFCRCFCRWCLTQKRSAPFRLGPLLVLYSELICIFLCCHGNKWEENLFCQAVIKFPHWRVKFHVVRKFSIPITFQNILVQTIKLSPLNFEFSGVFVIEKPLIIFEWPRNLIIEFLQNWS